MNDSTTVDGAHPYRDFVVTETKLHSCQQRPPNFLSELSEFGELAKILADDPMLALRHLLKVARHLSSAGSAGVSLLRADSEGRETISWEIVSGALAAYEGTAIPVNASPCVLCLRAGVTIRVIRPEQAYSGLSNIRPAIIEDLVIPLYDNARKALGTLWVAHHDQKSHFAADDAHVLERLAVQAVLAIKLMERSRERQHAMHLLESYHRAQRELFEHDLRRERCLRERAEESEEEIRRVLMLKESAIQETNHRAKNTLQVAAGVLSSHARATTSEPVRAALEKSQRSLQLLAKAHELLYRNGSSTQSILMSDLLEALGSAVEQSFAEAAMRVALRVVVEPLGLAVNEAIAIAMLANEALTNAYKYAFPNDAHGEITLSLSLASDGTLTLRISDDGIGMRSASSAQGLGLELVRAFAKQLGGELTMASAAGARGTVITLTLRSPWAHSHRHMECSAEAASSQTSKQRHAERGRKDRCKEDSPFGVRRTRHSASQPDP